MPSLTPAVPSPMEVPAPSLVAENASPRRWKRKLIVLTGAGIVVLIGIVLLLFNGTMAIGISILVIVGAAILVRLNIFVRQRKRRRAKGLVCAPTVSPQRLGDGPSASKNAPPPTDDGVAIQIEPTPACSPLYLKESTFTYEELAAATDDFSGANFLGEGGFGHVHKGVLPNGKQVAIKQLKAGSAQGEREFQTEIEIISHVRHRHLVSLVGYCIRGAQRMLVYDFVPNGTLEFHLHGKGRPTMSWATRMKIALGSAKGLAYLHEDCEPKIIHRDIKTANILLDNNFVPKVADFGLAKFIPDDDTHVSTQVKGTFGYVDPGYFRSRKLTNKSDVFSFGVVLLELITGRKHIYQTQSCEIESLFEWARPLLKQAQEGGNFDTLVDPRLQDYNSSEMAQMVACAAACMRHSASLRPRMSQILRALEGNVTLDAPNEGIEARHNAIYNEDGSSDYDTN